MPKRRSKLEILEQVILMARQRKPVSISEISRTLKTNYKTTEECVNFALTYRLIKRSVQEVKVKKEVFS